MHGVLILVLVPAVFQAGPVWSQTFDEVRQWEQTGQLSRARRGYEAILRRHPVHDSAALGVLRTSVKLGRWERAEQHLQRVEEVIPRSATSARWGVRLYYGQDQYDTALRWAQQYRERRPGSWEPYYYLARLHRLQGEIDRARQALTSASLRTDQPNQWVLLEQLLLRLRTDQAVNTQRLQKLLETAENPTVIWRIVRDRGQDWSRSRILQYLNRGADLFPAGSPPLGDPVDRDRYRYWRRRFLFELGRLNAARAVSSDTRLNRHAAWLDTLLVEDRGRRLAAQNRWLSRHPDYLPYRWQHSRLARSLEGLDGSSRQNAADFFYRAYRRNRFRDYTEAAFGAILRSLEMDPVRPQHQFELARFLHDRGWNRSERDVLARVRELGIVPASRVNDYAKGLGPADTIAGVPLAPRRLGVSVRQSSVWEGPVRGPETLASMLRQNLYHQPAFQAVNSDPSGADPRSHFVDRIEAGQLDGAVMVSIQRWQSPLEARLTLIGPGGSQREFPVYGRDRMGPWRVIQRVVRRLKDSWPWEGEVQVVERTGTWVNLGRVHGFNQGDSLALQTDRIPLEDRVLKVERIREKYLRLGFPTPYHHTQIPRGTPVTVPEASESRLPR